eukprot:TRINITY_DN90686_c0_g1_i1.p1 TRINITY_DN90686_c0_g1~~TRINITY_DN90686_c0_g1_i1.p1  ORF type:complete len:595 (-),score=117.99 TRINITY_DN90686_c0_g1_i1:71-1633(-)
MGEKAINAVERMTGLDLDGDGDVGEDTVPEQDEWSDVEMDIESEESDGGMEISAQEAAQQAFLKMEQGEKAFESSDDSDEEQITEDERRPIGGDIIPVFLPDVIKNYFTFLEILHEAEDCGRVVYFCIAINQEAIKNPGAGLKTGERCVVKAWYKRDYIGKETELKSIVDHQLRLLRMQRHPNVVQPRRIIEDEFAYYVEFEAMLVASSLFQVIISDSSTTEKWCRKLFRGIMQGLSHFHSQGLMHRDIKPENIMLQWQGKWQSLLSKHAMPPRGWLSPKHSLKRWRCPTQFRTAWQRHDLKCRVKIIDLDTVCDKVPYSVKDMKQGTSMWICGTPGYMAPEEIVGPSSPAGDLFSAGVMLYQLLRCQCPFHEIVFQTLRGKPLDLCTHEQRDKLRKLTIEKIESIDWDEMPWPMLPKARDLCKQLMDPNPANRGQDANDILAKSPWLNREVSQALREIAKRNYLQEQEKKKAASSKSAKGQNKAGTGMMSARGGTSMMSARGASSRGGASSRDGQKSAR